MVASVLLQAIACDSLQPRDRRGALAFQAEPEKLACSLRMRWMKTDVIGITWPFDHPVRLVGHRSYLQYDQLVRRVRSLRCDDVQARPVFREKLLRLHEARSDFRPGEVHQFGNSRRPVGG